MTEPRPPSIPDIVSPVRPSADEAVNRLVELAREMSQETTPAHSHALTRLERAIALGDAEPAGKVRRLGWWLLPAAAAAAGALWLHRGRAITFDVVSGKVGDGGYVSSGPSDATVTFSDRSDLGLAPDTRLRISDLEVRGARVMLEGGLLHVRINPETHGHWTLDAGPYIVHVTGTEFDLAWRVEEQTMDLRLLRGSVTVEGPLADGGVKVGRGQHLIASATAGTLSLVDENNPGPAHAEASAPVVVSPPAPPPPPGPSTPAEALSPTASTKSGSSHKVAARNDEPSWRARLAHGDFEGVLSDATRRGLDKVFSEASASDLAALADAARYARRSDLARRALIAERAHFPDSVEARDAPFFLGTLAQSEKNDASELEWYEVYLRESPSGAYAAEALGRRMMILQRVKGAEAARPLASEYIGRFGDGAYAPSARRLLQSQ